MNASPRPFFLRTPLGRATVIAAAYLIFCLVYLDDFGITWDEPVHFQTADFYLNSIINRQQLSFSASDFQDGMENYGPFFDILASLNQIIFSNKLKLLAADNSRHLHLVILASLTVFFTFLFANNLISSRCALFASLFLVTYPRFIGHSFNNPKDIPVTFIFVLCFYLFSRRIQTGKRLYSWLLGLAGGVGFATRITYIIVPVTILSYIIVTYIISIVKREPGKIAWRSHWDLILMIILSFPIGLLIWPYFWSQPITKLVDLLDFYYIHKVQGDIYFLYNGNFYVPGKNMPWHYAPVNLLITSPILTLGCFTLGLVAVAFRFGQGEIGKGNGNIFPYFPLLLFLWLVLGMTPFILPGQRVYGGIRHFLFIIPALCIVAGRGLELIYSAFRKKLNSKLAWVTVIILFAAQFILVYSYHPYYSVYYNLVVGGPKGAYGRYSLENWGNAYKRACLWLNEKAHSGARVLVMVAPQIPRYYLRNDIEVLGPEFSGFAPPFYDYSLYIIRDIDLLRIKNIRPEYCLSVKGQPILKLHKWVN